MTRLFLVAMAALTLMGCSQKQVSPFAADMMGAPGEVPAPHSVNRYLAYEHVVSIDAEADEVPVLFDAAQKACREAVADSCAILDSRLSSGDVASASLKFRAKAEGIRKLIAVLSTQGKIASQSTSAEDLAGPIEDTAKKLAMLTTYRSKLEGLIGRSDNNVDALIKLNRELAEVQGQIESLSGEQAHLVERVETEILNVSISSYANRSFWGPIGDSLSEFSDSLSDGTATAITAVAYLIPWSLVVLLLVWAVRKLWSRRK
jgi:Domain of unknown function (DUF4349)